MSDAPATGPTPGSPPRPLQTGDDGTPPGASSSSTPLASTDPAPSEPGPRWWITALERLIEETDRRGSGRSSVVRLEGGGPVVVPPGPGPGGEGEAATGIPGALDLPVQLDPAFSALPRPGDPPWPTALPAPDLPAPDLPAPDLPAPDLPAPDLLAPIEPAPSEGRLAAAVDWLSRSLDGLQRGVVTSRFLARPGRDQLVGPAESVEVLIDLGPSADGPLATLAPTALRLSVGERVIEAPVRGPIASGAFGPLPVGTHRVSVAALAPGAPGAPLRVLGEVPDERRARIQVVDRAPIVAVLADALLAGALPGERAASGSPGPDEAPSSALAPLRDLVLRGWALVVVDHDPRDRASELRAVLERAGLPACAVLVHPSGSAPARSFGVDFRRLLAATTLRRARAAGAPIVLVVGPGDAAPGLDLGQGARAVGLTALATSLASLADEGETAARAFVVAREAAKGSAAWRLDHVTLSRSVPGNACRVELDNRRAREAVFRAIEGATHSVHIQLYILEPGRFTDHLVVRLIGRARAGVRVRLLVDAVYSRERLLGSQNPVARVLAAEPGIEVRASDPIEGRADLDGAALKERDHRKLVVVDGRTAFVSGRNAGDAYYTGFDEVAVTDVTPHEQIPWLDAHAELRGPVVAGVQEAFMSAWARNGGALDPTDQGVFPSTRTMGRSRLRLILKDGTADLNSLAAYEALLDAARERVTIVNGFPVFAGLAAAIRRAVGRGVRVLLVTGSALTRRADGTFLEGPLHRRLLELLTKHRLEPLLRDGASVVEYVTAPSPLIVVAGGALRPYVHAKLVIVDGLVASVGSANLDDTASFWEREANVVIEDPLVVGPLELEVQAIAARGVPLDATSDAWLSESAQRAVAARLWPDVIYS